MSRKRKYQEIKDEDTDDESDLDAEPIIFYETQLHNTINKQIYRLQDIDGLTQINDVTYPNIRVFTLWSFSKAGVFLSSRYNIQWVLKTSSSYLSKIEYNQPTWNGDPPTIGEIQNIYFPDLNLRSIIWIHWQLRIWRQGQLPIGAANAAVYFPQTSNNIQNSTANDGDVLACGVETLPFDDWHPAKVIKVTGKTKTKRRYHPNDLLRLCYTVRTTVEDKPSSYEFPTIYWTALITWFRKE